MEFNIVGEACKDFENKTQFYARYPVDIVDRVLLFMSHEIPNISDKFHSNKLSTQEKRVMCELLEYFTKTSCQDLKTSEIKGSYPDYIFEKLSTEKTTLSQKMKRGEELTSKEKESVCLVLDELFNCSNYNTELFKKLYKGKRLDNALKSLKKDPYFFKKFQSDTLSKSQKSDLCYMLEYRLKPTYFSGPRLAMGVSLSRKKKISKKKSAKRIRTPSPKRRRSPSPKRKRTPSPRRRSTKK